MQWRRDTGGRKSYYSSTHSLNLICWKIFLFQKIFFQKQKIWGWKSSMLWVKFGASIFSPSEICSCLSEKLQLHSPPNLDNRWLHTGILVKTATNCCLTYPMTSPTGASTETSIWQHWLQAQQRLLPPQHLKSRTTRITSWWRHKQYINRHESIKDSV